jgi:hypothetical protein
MARRPGVIRQAVERTARQLVAQRRAAVPVDADPRHQVGVTYLDLEAALVPQGVGRQAVRRTLERLAREEVLPRVGSVHLPHSRKPLGVYAPPANDEPQPGTPGLDLQALLCSGAWAQQA